MLNTKAAYNSPFPTLPHLNLNWQRGNLEWLLFHSPLLVAEQFEGEKVSITPKNR